MPEITYSNKSIKFRLLCNLQNQIFLQVEGEPKKYLCKCPINVRPEQKLSNIMIDIIDGARNKKKGEER